MSRIGPTSKNKSLFNCARIIAAILVSDGKFDEKESNWFEDFLKKVQFDQVQIQLVKNDLLIPPSNIEEIFREINYHDRFELMSWAKQAALSNKQVTPEQRKIINLISSLQMDFEVPQSDQIEYAREILKHEANIRFWRELGEFGKHLSLRVTPFNRSQLFISSFSLPSKKIYMYIFIALVALALLSKILAFAF